MDLINQPNSYEIIISGINKLIKYTFDYADHTRQPWWLQNRETSLFTRSEKGSLPIWGLMTFPRIKNAPACQGFGLDKWQNLVWLSSLTSMFCRLPLITSNITLKLLASDCLLITDRAYSKNPCKKGIIRVKYHHFWPSFIKQEVIFKKGRK